MNAVPSILISSIFSVTGRTHVFCIVFPVNMRALSDFHRIFWLVRLLNLTSIITIHNKRYLKDLRIIKFLFWFLRNHDCKWTLVLVVLSLGNGFPIRTLIKSTLWNLEVILRLIYWLIFLNKLNLLKSFWRRWLSRDCVKVQSRCLL